MPVWGNFFTAFPPSIYKAFRQFWYVFSDHVLQACGRGRKWPAAALARGQMGPPNPHLPTHQDRAGIFHSVPAPGLPGGENVSQNLSSCQGNPEENEIQEKMSIQHHQTKAKKDRSGERDISRTTVSHQNQRLAPDKGRIHRNQNYPSIFTTFHVSQNLCSKPGRSGEYEIHHAHPGCRLPAVPCRLWADPARGQRGLHI